MVYADVPRVGIIEDDLVDSIVSGSVGPHGWMGVGVDTKQWQNGRHFLLWKLQGRENKETSPHDSCSKLTWPHNLNRVLKERIDSEISCNESFHNYDTASC